MAGQLSFEYRTRGGARRGAGRPARGARPSERHLTRAKVRANEPVHVIVRAKGVGLRVGKVFAAIRGATTAVMISEAARAERAVAKRDDKFRIIHLSVQTTHIHAIVEASDQFALARGMQGFLSSAAKRINRALERRRATVFPDRYHAVVLRSPTQVRNTLAYVMNNWRHHGEDRHREWKIDPFSTGVWFDGWRERADEPFLVRWRSTYDPLYVWRAESWLLRVGWRRGGPLVGYFEVPGGNAE